MDLISIEAIMAQDKRRSSSSLSLLSFSVLDASFEPLSEMRTPDSGESCRSFSATSRSLTSIGIETRAEASSKSTLKAVRIYRVMLTADPPKGLGPSQGEIDI